MTNYKRVTNVNGQDRLFFDKRKGMLKIDQSVKMPCVHLLTGSLLLKMPLNNENETD